MHCSVYPLPQKTLKIPQDFLVSVSKIGVKLMSPTYVPPIIRLRLNTETIFTPSPFEFRYQSGRCFPLNLTPLTIKHYSEIRLIHPYKTKKS